jgi:hypothetical protein
MDGNFGTYRKVADSIRSHALSESAFDLFPLIERRTNWYHNMEGGNKHPGNKVLIPYVVESATT